MEHWDEWQARAVERGVAADIADLGRAVLRDHMQHGLGPECLGAPGDGELMMALALEVPNTAFNCFMGAVVHEAGGGADADEVAFRMLCDRVGSEAAAESALMREKPAADEVWRRFLER